LTIWTGFIVLVTLLLSLDLGVFHRRSHTIRVREALVWTAFWACIGLLFNVLVYFLYEHHWLGIGMEVGHPLPGREAAKMFLAGYLLEFSLSVDNIFVIALIISYFRVPAQHQHRVLFWGILGALVMRGTMILLGTQLVKRFEWMIFVFGVLLIITAIRMLFMGDEEVEPDRNLFVRIARRIYPVTSTFEGPKFFTRLAGKRAITPLFLVILVIESTDLLFAIDSIPAVIGITHDPFLVFTSNVFAIMGLRSLYFALAGMMNQFRYLKISLVILLVFIGVKMIVARWVHIETNHALLAIAGILGIGVTASIVASRGEQLLAAATYLEPSLTLGRAAWRQVRRLVVFVVGSTVVLLGVVMIVTPGPACVVIPLGLLILSYEFVWAKKLLEKVKDRIKSMTGRSPADKNPPQCKKCGYWLRDLTEKRCPECGQPFELPAAEPHAGK
jgi:tellurite resistance protein TerC